MISAYSCIVLGQKLVSEIRSELMCPMFFFLDMGSSFCPHVSLVCCLGVRPTCIHGHLEKKTRCGIFVDTVAGFGSQCALLGITVCAMLYFTDVYALLYLIFCLQYHNTPHCFKSAYSNAYISSAFHMNSF